jgi:hypothetical protein
LVLNRRGRNNDEVAGKNEAMHYRNNTGNQPGKTQVSKGKCPWNCLLCSFSKTFLCSKTVPFKE